METSVRPTREICRWTHLSSLCVGNLLRVCCEQTLTRYPVSWYPVYGLDRPRPAGIDRASNPPSSSSSRLTKVPVRRWRTSNTSNRC